MNDQRLRVCYFGTYRADYSRNQIMIEGLRCNGVEVIECHEQLWRGIEDRVRVASGEWLKPGFWRRALRTYGRLLQRYRSVGDYDILIVGYPGQLDVFLARLLSWLRHKPLVWDIFMSIYLIALERGLAERSHTTMSLIRLLERIACRLPNLLILDTAEHVAWFQTTHSISSDRFRLVPTGADDRLFRPLPTPPRDGRFRVLFYGTFIPLHGVEIVIRAAALLRDQPDIHFDLVGEGPEKALAMGLVEELGLTNVTFHGWIERSRLPEFAARADICLGVFGDTKQGRATIQNKIYEGLALGKPVITGDSETVRATLQHGEHVYLVPREDPEALAEAILRLHDDPLLRQRLADGGYRLFRERYTLAAVGACARRHLEELLDQWRARR